MSDTIPKDDKPVDNQGQTGIDWGAVTLDDLGYSKLIENEAFKKLDQSRVDKAVTQAIKTFKANHEKEFEEQFNTKVELEIKKRFPDESPESKQVRELARENEALKEQRRVDEIINKAFSFQNAKGIGGIDLAQWFAKPVKDVDEANDRIEEFATWLQNEKKKEVEKLMAQTATTVKTGDDSIIPRFTSNQQWKDYLKNNPEKARDPQVLKEYTKFCETLKRRT